MWICRINIGTLGSKFSEVMMAQSITFPKRAEFEIGAAEEKEKNRVLYWDELSIGEIFGVIAAEKTEHKKFGVSYIIHIQNENNCTFKVWCPKVLSKKLFEERPLKHNCFISSLGVEEIKDSTGEIVKKKYLFDYTYKADPNAIKNYLM